MNSYELSRKFWDWCYENPELIKPNHSALYFFIIEHCNRLGWKRKFGLPTTMAKEAIGIKSYNTYINTLNDLVSWGFIEMIETSKNQYSSNIVALSNFNKACDKALDKALIKHTSKQSESTGQSIGSINKQVNNKPINKETVVFAFDDIDYIDTMKKYELYICEKRSLDFGVSGIELESMQKQLHSWSSGDFNKAINIINANISNGWKTLNFVKESDLVDWKAELEKYKL